jgi:hypothetical protein
MKVIFDTCALHDDLAMTGLSSQMILGQATRGRFDLVVPGVVFLEMVNKMRERIETATAKMTKGALSLKKIGVGDEIRPPQHRPLTGQFTEDLKKRIVAAGTLVPIPDVGHEELVSQSIIGKKPFRTSGVGYRDALIWQTVLDQAHHDDVVFVSGNSNDFGESEKLFPELAAEVASCPHDVTLLASVEEFIEKHVPPADQALEKAQQLLRDATFRAGLEREVTGLLLDADRWPFHLDVTLVPGEPAGILSEGPHLTYVDTADLLAIDIDDALEFDPDAGTAVLSLTVEAELMLDLLFDKSDAYWLLESEAQVSFYDFDYSETYAAGQTVVVVKGELQALFTESEDEIDQIEFVSLRDLTE